MKNWLSVNSRSNNKDVILSEERKQTILTALNSATGMITARYSALAKTVGKVFGGKRDYYESMGYPRTLTYQDYDNMYSRNGVGKRIVRSFPNACWRFHPYISDDSKTGAFASAFNELAINTKMFKYIQKGDILSRIGEYGVIFMGFDDGLPFNMPVPKKSKLLYLQAYNQNQTSISSFIQSRDNPLCGKPEFYNITPGVTGNISIGRVHHTRIIHLAEDAEGNDTFGTPAMKGVYNNVLNIDMISAAATEGYWRGGFAGMVAEIDKDVDFDEDQKTAFKEQMSLYIDGFQRSLRGQGAKFKFPQASVLQPTKFLEAQYDMISADTRIPKRILIGSEMAKVASAQDAGNWNNVVDDRRINYCEPSVLRPVIDRCVEFGALPMPKSGKYKVEWPDMESADERRDAETSYFRAKSLAAYAQSEKAQQIMSKEDFLSKILGINA